MSLIRCIQFFADYDGYDDVYGHSVEDDYCISPSGMFEGDYSIHLYSLLPSTCINMCQLCA